MGGIGSAIVVTPMQRNFDVVATDRVIDRALAADLVPRANSEGKLACVAGDRGDIDGLPRFVDAVFAPFGRIDVLVNNAGMSAMLTSTSMRPN
ncbi:MAG: SDR family NAD(P)-dependent oxidoreductase, partial [Burkholderia vietnamiensis]|nr:SDR family NAD(P)-dependent oxidoreductase [Burkholderia vietnamiensis]